MLEALKEIEELLPEMLPTVSRWGEWKSLLVDYHHPHVWRLWRQVSGEHRVLLHKIFPCESSEALLHPHPWPAAMRIFTPEGSSYETGVGWGHPESADPPPTPAKFVLKGGSTYEMTDYRAWHYVRPIGGPIYSVMVIGAPHDIPKQKRFGQNRKHKHLNLAQCRDLLEFFRQIYPSGG